MREEAADLKKYAVPKGLLVIAERSGRPGAKDPKPDVYASLVGFFPFALCSRRLRTIGLERRATQPAEPTASECASGISALTPPLVSLLNLVERLGVSA